MNKHTSHGWMLADAPIPERRYSIAEARGSFARVVAEAQEGPVTINKRGTPVAVVLSPEEYARLSAPRGSWLDALIVGTEGLDVDPEAVWGDARDPSTGRDAPFEP